MIQLHILLTALAIGCSAATVPRPPSKDTWYEQPANISSYAPGDLIRSRQVSDYLQPLIAIPVDISVDGVYQYMYRSTDSLGDAVAGVTTLIIPHGADPMKLLAYQTAYDSSNPDCSPSYTIQNGSAVGGLGGMLAANSTMSIDTPFLVAALNQGWWVMTTDYEGLKGQYTVGPQSGSSTLDSVRVILKEAPKLGLSKKARYALWGYSGGALASGWAAELQPTYAPELEFAGVALGGAVPSVLSVLNAINTGLFSGLAFGVVNGIANAYPNFTQWVDENLLPEKKEEFLAITKGCLIGEFELGALQDVYSYFKGGKESFGEDVPTSVLAMSGEMGQHGTPTIPLFVYHAVWDEISPSSGTEALVRKYCSEGATVYYQRDWVGEHNSEAITGAVNALAWVSDRLAGVAVSHEGSCVTKNVYLADINPSNIGLLGEALWAVIVSVFGGVLGAS